MASIRLAYIGGGSTRAPGTMAAFIHNHGTRFEGSEVVLIDLVLLGIKTWGDERHRSLTGREIEPTLAFARRLAGRNQPVWVRFVLVPGLTDNAEDIDGIAAFAAGLGNVQRVDVLPFHQLGKYKWERLKLRYALEGVAAPVPSETMRAVDIFKRRGLSAY